MRIRPTLIGVAAGNFYGKRYPVGGGVPTPPQRRHVFAQTSGESAVRSRRARRPRRAGSSSAFFVKRWANSQPSPVGKGLAPSGSKCSDKHLPTANSQTCRGFAEGRAMSYRVLRGKDKSFPYRGVCAYLSDLAGIKAFSAALTLSLPQQGRVSPTKATGEGERGGTAM